MIQSDWYYTLCAGGRIASSFLRCWSIAGHCGRRTRPWPTLLTTPASFTTGSPQAPRIICSITWKHNLQMSIIIKYIIGSLVSLFLKKTEGFRFFLKAVLYCLGLCHKPLPSFSLQSDPLQQVTQNLSFGSHDALQLFSFAHFFVISVLSFSTRVSQVWK